MERFNLKKLKEAEGKEQYCVVISNRFAALEILKLSWILIELGKLWERTHFGDKTTGSCIMSMQSHTSFITSEIFTKNINCHPLPTILA
jgi:hypothetical protein